MTQTDTNDGRTNIQSLAGVPEAMATFVQTIQATYSQLESCLEEARKIVPVQTVEQLFGILPNSSIESKRFVWSELIKLDMLAAHQKSITRSLDFYMRICQTWFISSDVPIDLILTEIQIRKQSDQHPTLDEYQRKFSRWADALAELDWEAREPLPSLSVVGLPELQNGQLIDDFRIVGCLGRGAFAQVYLARQESMQRLVALKISSQGSEEPQTLSQLDHPNIVRVYDQRFLAKWGIHLLYMQAILGGSLAGVIKATCGLDIEQLSGRNLLEAIDQALHESQQQPPERMSRSSTDLMSDMNWASVTAWLGAQLAEGLQAAHDQGVLHCDVKPANILLGPSGNPKLVDFNVSDRGLNQIRERRIGGTLAYMSPEHLAVASDLLEPNRIDIRCDLYSLALSLWELWQGRRPWYAAVNAETWRSAVSLQLDLRRQPLDCVRADASLQGVWLEQVLRQCLQTEPDKRPRSCAELATRLRLALHPELVARFAPQDSSVSYRLAKWPVLLITALIIFSTNGPAGAMNFIYNREVIVRHYDQLLPHFNSISAILNLIAFPFGGVLLVFFCWRVKRSRKRAEHGLVALDQDLDWLWQFGHRAAVISGSLWLFFGLLFPVVLQRYEPNLSGSDFVHFFLSLAVCGGIALIYPFFGISLLACYVYYPLLLRPSMRDDKYVMRAHWLRRHSDVYLALAALVPLLAILLLILMRSQAPLMLQVLLVLITLISLFVSFQSHRRLHRILDLYSAVLGKDAT